MLSAKQEEIIRKKTLMVAKHFIQNGGSMEGIEKATGISKSSAQRYLHSPIITEALGQAAFDTIQDKLAENKKEALSKGGHNSVANNIIVKDEDGKFAGSRKR